MSGFADDQIFGMAILPVLLHEGDFQNDAQDRGNWTGGAIGVGENRGTKYGISAAEYPTLDIAGLTMDEAKAIYYRDYWLKSRINLLPGILIPTKVLDTTVLCGGWGTIILQRSLAALGLAVVVDGSIGPATAKACSSASTDALLSKYRDLLVEHFDEIVANHPYEEKFLRGWEARAES